jgi:cardiolipin synthase
MPEFWRELFGSTTGMAAVLGYFFTWFLIPWVLLKRRVHESAAVAWIIGILFVPFVGAILCVLVGNMRWEKQSRRKRKASEQIQKAISGHNQTLDIPKESLGRWAPLAYLSQQMTGMAVTTGNEIEHLPDTKESLKVLEEMIRAAKTFVHIEFYILRHDETGERIQKALIQKAQEGVQIRMLYDGIGSILLRKKYLKTMEAAGIKTAPFTPGLRIWPIGTLHLRNHRKIVVVDGILGFTGGMNIGNEYIRRTKSFGRWRDTQLRIRGAAVLQLQQVFSQDWHYATGEALTEETYFPTPEHAGNMVCQVVPDGPDNEDDTYYCLLIAALGLAQKHILISTPYFVPPDGLSIAIQTAARRGVRVQLVVADRGNYLWTKMAGRSCYDRLLSAGVEIMEYQDGLYHPKLVVMDGEWSLVGTANCDYRSLFLNFEVAVSSFDAALATELEAQIREDKRVTTKITLESWRQRSVVKRLHEEFWRLFAPIL